MKDKFCPKCGMTAEEYRRTGLWGCAECYRVFREEICASLRKLQGKVRHTGKAPAQSTEKNYARLLRRRRLKEELETAIREERYDDAERLQEELRALRGEDI